SDWPKLTDQQRLWYMASLATAAREASDWLRIHHNVSVPVRRLTKASANQPGFCSHQDREDWFGTKGRRTDPWRNDPAMWHLFLTLYEDAARAPQEDPVTDDDVERIARRVQQLLLVDDTAWLDLRLYSLHEKIKATTYTARDNLAKLVRRLPGA